MQLGCEKVFMTENPFDFMTLIGMEGKVSSPLLSLFFDRYVDLFLHH